MRVLYAILLLSSSTFLAEAQTFSIKPGFVIQQAPILPQAPAVGWQPTCQCTDGFLRCICGQECNCRPFNTAPVNDWTDMGAGYQKHSSGYYYHPSVGVYWPEPARPAMQPMFQPMGFGGFSGACVGGG